MRGELDQDIAAADLLIEPVWNRNMGSYRDGAPKPTFNRTSLE